MASLSYSSASMFKDCPKKYQYQYIIKGKPSIRLNTRPFLEGDVIHRILEQGFLTKKPLNKEQLIAVFPTYWNISVAHQTKQGVIQPNKNETLEGIREKTKLMLGVAIDYIKLNKWDEGDFYNEFPIGEWHTPYPLGEGLRVHGKADYVRDMGEGLFLADFKTSRDDKYLKAAQILLYIIVVEKKLGKPVTSASFIMLRNAEQIPVRVTEEDKKRVLDELIVISKSIDAGKFVATPGEKVCGDCIFRKDCPESMAKVSDAEAIVAEMVKKPQSFSLGELPTLE
jgi:CRISPR/Cas system-associated exonuclease Cas4 (RecB family)